MKKIIADLLLPRPRIAIQEIGRVDIGKLASFRVAGVPRESELEWVTKSLEQVVGRKIRRTDHESASVLLIVGEEGVAGKGPESYRLSLTPDYVEIAGKTLRAIYYGVQTLGQIIEAAGRGAVPPMEIQDWPEFAFRGYSDDISRRQISSLKDFEFIIGELSRFKCNYYQPYIEDVVFVDRQPALGRGRGRLSRDEIGWMVEYGKRHFIEIMPQFNSLSHAEHMLSTPEYAGWRFRGNLETLDPENPEVRAFIRDVYAQLFEQFPCEYFHMGLDEARGLTDRPDLFCAHTNWLAEIVLAAGRRPVMWHDMFVPYDSAAARHGYGPRLLDKLNKEIIQDLWLYEVDPARAAFITQMTRRGFRTLLSPALDGGVCGGGGSRRWKAMAALLEQGVQDSGVAGVNMTSWNDFGSIDRHVHWRGLAMSAEMSWRGALADSERKRVNRAFASQFLGIRDVRRADALTETADFASELGGLDRNSVIEPRALAQGVTSNALSQARSYLRRERKQKAAVVSARTQARRNAEHLDHILFGLERLRTGAERTLAAPKLAAALLASKTALVERQMKTEAKLVRRLRAGFADMWLRRSKPEGLEYADLRFRNTLHEMETIAWNIGHDREYSDILIKQGLKPIDLSKTANYFSRDYAALAWGTSVLDNIPWRVVSARGTTPRQFVATRSKHLPEQPERVSVKTAGVCATRLHALHALYGNDRDAGTAGKYRIVFADATVQEVLVRCGPDAADWWMPYGHPFGGGGIYRIDPSTCRLAFLAGPDEFQGHCLYHFWVDIERNDVAIERIEICAGTPEVSLVVAGLTVEQKRAG